MKKRVTRLTLRTDRDRRRELEEELEAHIALRVSDLEARGWSSQDARAEAERRFGDLEEARTRIAVETRRRDRRLRWSEQWDDVRRDVRVSVRRLRTRPARSALPVLIFGLGVGLSTAMFTLVDSILLQALPFPEPDRLVELQSVTEAGDPFSQVSMGNWFDWRAESGSLEETALYRSARYTMRLGAGTSRIDGAQVTSRFFQTLRAPLVLGRAFSDAEAQDNARVAVVSHGFWRSTLGSTRDLAARSVELNGLAYQVVGVVAEGFDFPRGADLWIPQTAVQRTGGARNNINFQSIARLSAESSLASAAAELSGIARGIRERDPEGIYSYGVGVRPLRQAVVGSAASNLRLLMAAVLLVLLIACVNLTGIGLARGRERQSEVAVRLALGSNRRRLVQQLMTEQVLLASVGGVLALAIAWAAIRVTTLRLPNVLPRVDEVSFDVRVAVFGIGLSLLAGLASGALPAWSVSGRTPAAHLANARVVRSARTLPGTWLVGAEIALTVVLVWSGALLAKSMGSLLERELGFEAEDVVTLEVPLVHPTYTSDLEQIRGYWSQLADELQNVPGVVTAGVGTGIPTGGGGATFLGFPDDPESDAGARYRVVNDAYFHALGVGVVQGRTFHATDLPGSERVTVVSQAFADTYWPGQDVLGKRVSARSMESYWFGGTAPMLTVVGVVADVRHSGFEDDIRPTLYALYRQIPQLALDPVAVVRTRPGEAARLTHELVQRARDVDPGIAVEAGLLSPRVEALLGERKLVTSIVVAFAAMGLGLACLGIYGLLSFTVSMRTRELAVRAVLGAGRASLVHSVVRGALVLVLVGAAVGSAVAVYGQGLLEDLLVDASAGDVRVHLLVGGALLSVALAAAMTPAVRAARMDPAEALRFD